jgi:predicted RNA-binding protein with PUA-like domain
MNYWLLKTEGEWYPIDKLKAEKKTPWSGVRNFQARNYMRDQMQVGDLCLFYHSSSKANGVYGIAKVASKPYADPTQFDKKGHYFEPRSTKEKPVWMLVDIAFVKKFKHPVLLSEMKLDPELAGMLLWRANRLSIQPVSEKHFEHIVELAAYVKVS